MFSISSPLSPMSTPHLRTDHDVLQHWRRLVGRPGHAARELWITFVDPLGQVQPTLPIIEDIPLHPARRTARNLVESMAVLIAESIPGGSVAFMLARPGPVAVTVSDQAWARALSCEVARAGLRPWPLCASSDTGVHHVAPEEQAA